MNPKKILHVGDLQLGQKHYGNSSRADDVFKALDKVLGIASDYDVGTIIFAGDLFEFRKMPGDVVRRAVDVLDCWRRQHPGVDMIGIDGNHDAFEGAWPAVLGMRAPEPLSLVVNGPGFRIIAMNYCKPDAFWAELKVLHAKMSQSPMPSVFVMHYPLGDMLPIGGCSEITAENTATLLSEMGVEYVAMGDIHNYMEKVVTTAKGNVTYIYPGSIELTDINETLPKSVVLLDATPHIEHERVTFETRPVLRAVVDDEAAYTALQLQLKTMTDAGKKPVVEIKVNADVPDLASRVRTLVHGLPQSVTSLPKSFVSVKAWDRKEAKVDLAAVIGDWFKPGTIEHQLVSDIVAAPANLDAVVEAYLKSLNLSR